MPKFDKPDSPNIIWGVNALEEDLTRPDDSYIQTGWTQVKPPYEYENYSMNKLYQGFAYYNQLGFPEWDAVTEYQAGKSYVQGSNDRIYKCVQTHTNRNPTTSGNETFWEIFEGNRQAGIGLRGTTGYATNTQASAGIVDNVAVTPAALLDGFLSLSDSANKGSISIPVNFSGVRKDFIIKWDTSYITSSQGELVSFKTAFPEKCLLVIPTDTVSASNQIHGLGIGSVTKSDFKVFGRLVTDGSDDDPGQITYLAIGY